MSCEHSENSTALIIGAQSTIARALADALLAQKVVSELITVSRENMPARAHVTHIACNHEADQIVAIADQLTRDKTPLSRVFICTGILHGGSIQPEKSLQALDPATMTEVFKVNCVIPALWVKALLPALKANRDCVLTAFSARVGSISDNHKGGWYSYRTSKAALNMLLKTAAVEYARQAPCVKLLSFHPGTVDTPMSTPFQKHVPPESLFTAEFVAQQLIKITDKLTADGDLSYLDWQGKPILW